MGLRGFYDKKSRDEFVSTLNTYWTVPTPDGPMDLYSCGKHDARGVKGKEGDVVLVVGYDMTPRIMVLRVFTSNLDGWITDWGLGWMNEELCHLGVLAQCKIVGNVHEEPDLLDLVD